MTDGRCLSRPRICSGSSDSSQLSAHNESLGTDGGSSRKGLRRFRLARSMRTVDSLPRLLFVIAAVLLALPCTPRATAQENSGHLLIYSIDVEGGQATLLVSPSKASLLVDTGWPGNGGRDA